MTFDRWAKELLLNELKCNGEVKYDKKGGWYCYSSGFLLRVAVEKISFGFFRINYEVMPLVAKLRNEFRHQYLIMFGIEDAEQFYCKIKNFSLAQRADSPLQRSKIELPETYEVAASIICEFLNPFFNSLTSYRQYCIECIDLQFMLLDIGADASERRQLAIDSFEHGAPSNKEIEEDPLYAKGYPWHTIRMTELPYVYAALGKYEEAVTAIRTLRSRCIELDQSTYENGYITKADYESRIEKENKRDAEIEQAMAANDHARCKAILDKNYQENRIMIREHLGFELPETWEQFVD